MNESKEKMTPEAKAALVYKKKVMAKIALQTGKSPEEVVELKAKGAAAAVIHARDALTRNVPGALAAATPEELEAHLAAEAKKDKK